jgi:hypothetical protein
MEHQSQDQTTSPGITEVVSAFPAQHVAQARSRDLLPAPEQASTSLMDDAATEAMAAIFGAGTRPREALRQQIQINAAALDSGDTSAMLHTLSRQSTALEIGMHGLLVAMAKATSAEHRLVLAKAAATLHGAALRSLSAIQQINREPSPRTVT